MPLPVPVRALRLGYQNGERMVTTGGTGTTDDQGAYRIAGLLPGEYLVTAVPRDTVSALAAAAAAVEGRAAQIQAAARSGSAEAKAAAITMEQARREGRMPEPVSPMVEYLVKWNELLQFFWKEPVKPIDGMVTVPDRPGLGVELDPDKIEREDELGWVDVPNMAGSVTEQRQ